MNRYFQTNKRVFFNQNHTKPVEFRIQQLKKLRGPVENTNEKTGCTMRYMADFKKSGFDTYLDLNSAVPMNELDIAISHLKNAGQK